MNPELKTLLLKLFATYPNTNLTEQTLVVYAEMLGELPLDELRAAIDQCLRECKFLPTVAEILEKHRALSGALTIHPAPEAWLSVQRAIREVGQWGMPKFRNDLTAKTVEAMGWENLCLSRDPGVDRAQFERFYNSFLQRQTELDRLLPASRAMLEQSEVNKIFRGLAGQMRITGPKPEVDEEPPF